MTRKVNLFIFLTIFITKGFCSGFDIKTSSVIDQPGIEVLGNYKGSWYLIGFEKPGRLKEPPKYQIFKYAAGFPSAKTSPMYPSFGEKTVYLQSAFINNKISMFYGRCERLAEVEALGDNREGHKEIPTIFCQDYDPNTLEPVGSARVIFNRVEDGFAASGMDIIESEDRSKTVVLIKPYYKQQNYKIILTDNQSGQLYAQGFSFKSVKDYLEFKKVKVGNNGQVLLQTKRRDDIITLSANTKDGKLPRYYFFSIDKSGNETGSFNLAPSMNNYMGEPVMALLNSGETIVAHDLFQDAGNTVLKGILVAKYDSKFNLINKKEIVPDAKLLALALPFQELKKENGLPYLETQQLLPLDNGKFMLLAEYHRIVENRDKVGAPIVQRYYLVSYRLDEKLVVSDFQFIPKKQVSASVDYAFSALGYRKGNDVFLFHNDDRESEDEHGMNLQCTRLSVNIPEPETQKITHTSDDFFTSMKRFYPSSDGKILFTEEKLVDYESVSREIKLLEVTLK